jgi:hypothetical protein
MRSTTDMADATGGLGVGVALSRQRFQIEYATDIIYTTDEQGRFVHFNPHAAATILGFSRDELLGRHYLDMVHCDHRASTGRFYGRQFARRIPTTYKEVPCTAKDGSLVWLGQNVQLLTDGGRPVGFQSVARDITGRIRNEQMAARQTALLELIARNASLTEVLDRVCKCFAEMMPGHVCAVLVEEQGRMWHAAAPQLPSGYVREIDGVEVDPQLMATATRGSAVRVDDLTAAGDPLSSEGLPARWSTPIISPSGRPNGMLTVYGRHVRPPKGDELAIISRCCDLAGIAIDRSRAESEVRRLQEELEKRVEDRTRELAEANVSLQQAMEHRRRTEQQLLQAKKLESVGRLAGGVAHEFNNWLTVIMLYTEELAEQTALNEASALCLDEIRRAAERASGLTRQLLAFGRKQMLQPKRIDLNALLCNLGNVLRSIMGGAIRLQMDLTPFVGTVKADPSQMEQVLVNLALNARDAMPEGGAFTLRTSNVTVGETGPAVDAGVPCGEFVLLEAADTGVGMDTATRERIFEPFFTTKEMGQGSGLGLATVYGVIQQSGGQIVVRSAPGRGATFQIYLPLLREAAAEAVPEHPAPPPRTWAGMRVLVVDDDAVIRRLVSYSLRRLGFSVEEAGDAATAEVRLEPGRYSLLITDIVMPGRSGLELAELARQSDPNLPVLFMSAYSQTAQENIGADAAYLGKPFTTQELGEKVRQVLAGCGRI